MGKKVTQGNIGRTPGENARVRRAFQRLSKSRQNLIGGGGLEELPNGGLGITDGGVTTSKLADGSVTTPKLADNAVTETKLADDSVTAAKLADDAVDTAAIQDNAVTEAKLADDSVTTAKLVDDSVTTPKIVDSAVTTPKLADASVTEIKLADDSVTSNKLVDSSVTTAKLADGSVTAPKLAADSVETVKIVDGAVTEAKLADGSVTTPKLADSAVTTAKVNDGSILTSKLGDLSVTAIKLATNAVTAVKIAANAVTLGKLGALTTKGDVLTHDGTSHKRLGVGANTQVLQADSSQTNGIKWTNFKLSNLEDVDASSIDAGNALRVKADGTYEHGFNLRSFKFTPTFTNLTNLDSVTHQQAVATQLGGTVRIEGSAAVNATVASTKASFRFEVPVPPNSDFTGGFEAIGGGNAASFSTIVPGGVNAVAATKTVEVDWEPNGTGTIGLRYWFSYRIF